MKKIKTCKNKSKIRNKKKNIMNEITLQSLLEEEENWRKKKKRTNRFFFTFV